MKNAKKEKRTQIPPRGDGEWDRKSLFEIIFYYQQLKYHKNYIIPLGSYIEQTQELTKCKN